VLAKTSGNLTNRLTDRSLREMRLLKLLLLSAAAKCDVHSCTRTALHKISNYRNNKQLLMERIPISQNSVKINVNVGAGFENSVIMIGGSRKYSCRATHRFQAMCRNPVTVTALT
jgi:microcompartment protein CcmK/EutM